MSQVDAFSRRWNGQSGRLEVWYATFSDPESGTGFWVHQEIVAPLADDRRPYVHGWAAFFSPEGEPVFERFGPQDVSTADHIPGGRVPDVSGITCTASRLAGSAGRLKWDIDMEPIDPAAPAPGTAPGASSRSSSLEAPGASAPPEAPEAPSGPLRAKPLFTFPAWSWSKEILPGCQVVPIPSARAHGFVTVSTGTGDSEDDAEDGAPKGKTAKHGFSAQARGNLAHIYGHGNARKWAWLHADLGNGEVLEFVSAVAKMPGLSNLPPLTALQLRVGGRDWPKDSLLAAPLFKAEIAFPDFRVKGTVGRWRLRCDVHLNKKASVAVPYTDPDGSTATCTNSEISDAEIILEKRGRSWEVARRWDLRGTAHAEIGERP